jgi:hypothetical protein
MALIELATVIAEDPAASRRWAAEPLPLTDRLTAVLTARFAALPEQTQAALLLAAVADGPDLSAAATAVSGPGAQTLAPAEQLGLIKIDRTGLQFSHPLIRSAIYHSAPRKVLGGTARPWSPGRPAVTPATQHALLNFLASKLIRRKSQRCGQRRPPCRSEPEGEGREMNNPLEAVIEAHGLARDLNGASSWES